MEPTVLEVATKITGNFEMEPEPKTSMGMKNEHGTSITTSSHDSVAIDNQTADDNPEENSTDERKTDEVRIAAAQIVNNQVINKEENIVAFQIEPQTGASLPVKLDDGKELAAVGLRKKSFLGIGIKIYGFGIYAETEKLKELLRSKIDEVGLDAAKPIVAPEMYQMVIDSDVGMTVRLQLVFPGITMSMVRKNFDEGLGASIKKLNGGKENSELTNMVMGEASNEIKLPAGSVIEITRFPGYILQTKVKDEVVSKVESKLLCRAYFNMYLGDDVFDMDAREMFGRIFFRKNMYGSEVSM